MPASGKGSVPPFGRRFFDGADAFTRIGSGRLGGKAAGLDRVRREVLARFEASEFPQVTVTVPTLTVLTTELFDHFIDRNQLYPAGLAETADERIAHAFQQANLPAENIGDLRALISQVHRPLAVRSSSLLEDALAHPFAGVYGTKMIPNNQPDADTRFRRLIEAIKFVYASTFFRGAKSYVHSIGEDLRREKMAVIIQEIIGTRHGDRFYPAVSGVARSHNYYPSGHARPEDGVINLALGLGKQIVDGGVSWGYSPAYPQAPPPFNGVQDLLKNTQTKFWAVNMGPPPPHDPIRETEYLVRAELAAAESDGALSCQVSTYDPRSDRMRLGLSAQGPRVIDFAPLRSGDPLVLNDLLRRLLVLTEEALGTAVEIEFALEIGRRGQGPIRFGFLQARPMMVSGEETTVTPEELVGDRVVLASEQALGNGVRDGIRDIVFLKPDVFAAEATREMVGELEGINHNLVAAANPYLLIGFGRWGSSDPWLGVPVEWGQINGARVVVEATLPDMNPDMSQGSHFFHNLISFHVFYLAVRHQGEFRIDWDWINSQPTVCESRFVKHVRATRPLTIRVDGRGGRGVITRGQATDTDS
ncbi:MAG: hypothetical protein KAY32_08325 [Candidatus Eisenbacteria sp.]|nr:hypothetical protein [Candidatus Eisenbacteria bacterium]